MDALVRAVKALRELSQEDRKRAVALASDGAPGRRAAEEPRKRKGKGRRRQALGTAGRVQPPIQEPAV